MYARLCPGRPEQALGYRRQSSWDGSSFGSMSYKLGVADTYTTVDDQTKLLMVMFDVAGNPSDTDIS